MNDCTRPGPAGLQKVSLAGTTRSRPGARTWLTVAAVALVAGLQVPASANHAFTLSTNVYRIPFLDNTLVTVTRDHHDHMPVMDRIDMVGPNGSTIVAAADGIIRAIVDNHGDDPEEHSCTDDATVDGICSDYNNYVWIEHVNGEWTKYSHFETGTVTGLGHQVGDAVLAGTQLGQQSDVGAATGDHLHFEVGIPNDPTDPTPFTELGGFLQGVNIVPVICDIPNNLFVTNGNYVALPCSNEEPEADAGGPYTVDEGSTVVLDGSGSSDPDGDAITFLWSPGTRLDDPASVTPVYSALDDTIDLLILTVTDGGDVTPASALSDTDSASVTVMNVPPSVAAQGSAIVEGGTAMVTVTFTDPGTADTHSATVDWGDGTAAEQFQLATPPGGGMFVATHVYGDNGNYAVAVTVTDDDGDAGNANAIVTVSNLDPQLTLDLSGTIAFPGGDYLVVNAGGTLPASAEGSDEGSDDLTFAWSSGGTSTYFNNGISADPPPPLSSSGVFPFQAADDVDAMYAAPGVQQLQVVLSDDDGGSDDESAGVIVTGNATQTEGSGWWKHQYSDAGAPHIDAATAAAYLAIVNAVSSVFSEARPVATLADVHEVLSPVEGDRRAHATAQLMLAWLGFASGAVPWDAQVPLGGSSTQAFLDLMANAEATILSPAASRAELQAVEQALQKVRKSD